MDAQVYGPDPVDIEGHRGLRYWVHDPYEFTGNAEVDGKLSGFPVAIFMPNRGAAADAPLVLCVQGMAQPWQASGFAVPVLLGMGIACVLLDSPLAGERSFVPQAPGGDMLGQLAPLRQRKVQIKPDLISRMVEAMTRNIRTALDLAAERHGLRSPRLALFGVSLGGLYVSQAFMRDGLGQRLLCAMSQPDLYQFARSYAPVFATAAAWAFSPLDPILPDPIAAGRQFAEALNVIQAGGDHCVQANPMTHMDRIGPDRRVRLLIGADDGLCRPDQAVKTAKRLPDGECYVVPGWGHGGPGTELHCGNFLRTQLADWAQA
jgi:pimeloyl-ACP methyl ester carboxylesterase